MPSALSGKAVTVLGVVEAETMGVTLPHEHLLIDFAVMFKEPAAASDKGLARQPVSLANVGWVRQNFNANLDNLRLLDEQTAVDEIALVVRAAVEAQRQTGAPLMIHPGRDQAAPMQIVELIRKQGGDLRRTIMCHIDRTISDERHLFDLAATGVYLEYDLFGMENSYYPYNPDFDMPNDGGRMTQILKLIARGHQDQILMSHDIAYKSSLTKYGGPGYHHPLVHVVPRLRRKGVDDAGLQRLLVENPARAFVFV